MTKIKIIDGKGAGQVTNVFADRDRVRELLSWIVQTFVDDLQFEKSEKYFCANEGLEGVPEGKAVKVTFEYVDLSTCGTCGAELSE